MAFPSKLLNPGEHVVVSTRTHPKALVIPGLVVLVALAAAVFVDGLVDGSTASLVVWALVLAVLVWFLVGPLLRWLTTTYTFTNPIPAARRLSASKGKCRSKVFSNRVMLPFSFA